MEFGSGADTPLWEFWCEGVSGFCYQKGSPLDIESVFRLGERCLHTDTPTLHILHLDTITAKSSRTDTPLLSNCQASLKNLAPELTTPSYIASVRS